MGCLFYVFNRRKTKGKHFNQKLNRFTDFTDVCQRNKTREFHWLLKIVVRLQRELRSLNERVTSL